MAFGMIAETCGIKQKIKQRERERETERSLRQSHAHRKSFTAV